MSSSGLRVGLTGGLGSGKTTAGQMFAARGAHILSADELGRELMEPGTDVYDAIVARFGKSVAGPDQRLDRSELARLSFGENRVEELNAIVHPATIRRQGELAESIFQMNPSAIVVVESALIFETKFGDGWRERFDKIVLIVAPDALKIERFVARSGGAHREALVAEAKRRLGRMISDDEKRTRCDFVIHNDSSMEALELEVERVWSGLQVC